MKVAFRVDASMQIGTGHVMRCLTLADALSAQGAHCSFICREHSGNLIELIREKGHTVHPLPLVNVQVAQLDSHEHANWLGCSQAQDAAVCASLLRLLQPDWLVVDHYALDARWETALLPYVGKLMAIDDCADRLHVCDVLLDQNLFEDMDARYLDKVPKNCSCLLGPQYSLLRPDFSALRGFSIHRRRTPELKRLLVFMGGIDENNDTSKVLDGIKSSKRTWRHIDIVVGQRFPALKSLKMSLEKLASATLHIQTEHMAKLMAEADLAITGGGSVTWEKCSLGLPSLVVIQAANQYPIATLMHIRGAQHTLGLAADLTPAVYTAYLDSIHPEKLTSMTVAASALCAGDGMASVLKTMAI